MSTAKDPPSHLVHGMTLDAGDGAEPDWPPLTESEVRLVLGAAGLDTPAVIEWRSPRPFSAAALVRAGDRSMVVKRHDLQVRDARKLEAEHDFASFLAGRGIPVPPLLAPTLELGGCAYEILGVVPGCDSYRDAWSWTPYRSGRHAEAAGRALAELHLASEGYDGRPRPPAALLGSTTVIDAADPVAAIERLSRCLPGLAGFLALEAGWQERITAALAPFHERWRRHALHLEPLWAHGDWHPSNLFWTGPGSDATVSGVLDFGLCNLATAGYDLAVAIERACVEWLAPPGRRRVFGDDMAALVRGYLAVRSLSSEERSALPHLLPLAHVDYALSEIEYFHGIVGSAKNTRLAYEGYLLGHLAWFGSGAGRELCRRLAEMLGVPSEQS
ncbi:MAG TPA: phosphotransferase [Acidimicrobiales bacterium]|nr:phosphotransferase [Acidimicrobiales bacterium]